MQSAKSGKFISSFLAPLITASCIFCRKFEHDHPRIRFLRSLRSRIISNSSFWENSFWNWALHENLISRLVNFKTSYKSERLANRVQIFGKNAVWYRKRENFFPTFAKDLAKASCTSIMSYDIWIFKRTFIRATRKWQDFTIFQETAILRHFWHKTNSLSKPLAYIFCPVLKSFVFRLMPGF